MTCKDCIHCNICNKTESDIYLGNKEGAVELYCVEFADESQYIKLPCKVGDTVYHYCKEIGTILPYFVEQIVVDYDVDNSSGYWTFNCMCSENDELIDAIDFTSDEIGKTVFLSKSEVEKALRECEK